MSITNNDLKNVLKKYHNSIKGMINDKVDKVTGKNLSTNDYTTAEKTKLAGIATNANNYVHPATHSITEISGLQGELDSLKQYASNGKTTIASAITGKGITTPATATFEEMANNIKSIPSGLDKSLIKRLLGLYMFNVLASSNSASIQEIINNLKSFGCFTYVTHNTNTGPEYPEVTVNDYGVLISIHGDIIYDSTVLGYKDLGKIYMGYFNPNSTLELESTIDGIIYEVQINDQFVEKLLLEGGNFKKYLFASDFYK